MCEPKFSRFPQPQREGERRAGVCTTATPTHSLTKLSTRLRARIGGVSVRGAAATLARSPLTAHLSSSERGGGALVQGGLL